MLKMLKNQYLQYKAYSLTKGRKPVSFKQYLNIKYEWIEIIQEVKPKC